MDLLLSFTPIITTHIAEIAFLHYLLLNKKCFIFCLYISLKFRIFAISFQQLPHSVIDWGTIKNTLLSDENNTRNIYNTLLISSFVYNQALLAFISRRLWCSLRHLTLAFCSQLFWHTIHNSLQFGITDGFRDSRNYGFTELRKLNFALLRQTTRQRVNETTSSAKPLVVLLSCGLVVCEAIAKPK